MQTYKVAVGKSSYDIPYQSQDDLPQLKTVCTVANKLVNSIIAINQKIDNEFALILALINVIYEKHFTEEVKQESANTEQIYTQNDILNIISFLKDKLLEIEKCSQNVS